MSSIDQLRIQAVLLSDDDGTNGATVTPAALAQRVEAANTIYAPAGVSFLFDPATDVLQIRSTLLNRDLTVLVPPTVGTDAWSTEPPADNDSHHRARAALARIFARKIVVFCRPLTQLKKVDSTWKIAGKPNNSSWARYYIDLSKSGAGLTTLAHELGHYLQIRHTFSGADTVAEAAAAIKKAVDAGTLNANEGLQALDADRVWVLDTAADCDPGIFSDAGVSPCGQDGVPIEVALNGSTKTYTLKPDQLNLMSYHGCSGTKTVSAEQRRRVRDGLEIGMRHRLVSLRSTGREAIVKRSSAAAGAIGRFDVVAVRSGRAVTAVSDSANNLKVIVWDVSDTGAITRRGDASAGAVAAVSSCAIGLGMVATAVGTGSGLLKVILWKVGDAGTVTRKGDAVGAKCGEVQICRVGIEHLATASRRENGTLGIDLWHASAAGQVAHLAAAEAGAIGEAQPSIAIFPVGSRCFATSVRDGAGEVATILWNAENDTLTRLNKLDYPEKAGWVRGCAVDREVGVTAIRSSTGKLKLLSHNFPGDGEYALERGSADAGSIASVAVCRVGVEYVVTAVETSGGNGKLIAWHVTRDGDAIVRRDDEVLSGVGRMKLCQTGGYQFVVATRTAAGSLALTSWELRAPFDLKEISLTFALKDALQPVFQRVQISKETEEGCFVGTERGAM